MAADDQEERYTKELVLRTRAARGARVPKTTQAQMAELLHVDQTTYSKYESPGRPTQLPQRLIWPFCNICGVDLAWFLAGHGRGPAVEDVAIFEQKNIRSRKRPRKVRAA